MDKTLKDFERWADKVQMEANIWCQTVDWEEIPFPWADRFLANEPIDETSRALMRAARDEVARNVDQQLAGHQHPDLIQEPQP